MPTGSRPTSRTGPHFWTRSTAASAPLHHRPLAHASPKGGSARRTHTPGKIAPEAGARGENRTANTRLTTVHEHKRAARRRARLASSLGQRSTPGVVVCAPTPPKPEPKLRHSLHTCTNRPIANTRTESSHSHVHVPTPQTPEPRETLAQRPRAQVECTAWLATDFPSSRRGAHIDPPTCSSTLEQHDTSFHDLQKASSGVRGGGSPNFWRNSSSLREAAHCPRSVSRARGCSLRSSRAAQGGFLRTSCKKTRGGLMFSGGTTSQPLLCHFFVYGAVALS